MSSCFCFHVYNTDSGTHFQASFHHLLISVKRLEQLLSFLPFMFAEWSVLSHHKKAVRSKFSANNIQISAKKKKLSNHHDLWISSLLPTCPFVYFDHLTCLQFVPLMFITHSESKGHYHVMAVKNTIHRFIGFLSRKSHLRCRAWTRYIPDAKCQRGLYESHRQLIKHCSSALGQSLKFASLPHSPDDSQSPLRFTWQLIMGDSYSATICPLLFYTNIK